MKGRHCIRFLTIISVVLANLSTSVGREWVLENTSHITSNTKCDPIGATGHVNKNGECEKREERVNGEIKWAPKCEFYGGRPIHLVKVKAEADCGTQCLGNSLCTHFNFLGEGKCFLKKISAEEAKDKSTDFSLRCGFIVSKYIVPPSFGQIQQSTVNSVISKGNGLPSSYEQPNVPSTAIPTTQNPTAPSSTRSQLESKVNSGQNDKGSNPLEDWNIDQNGQVRWKRRCDFTGEEYDVLEDVSEEECGRVCLTDGNGCTHFASFEGSCYLKKLDNPQMEMSHHMARCGFIVKQTSTSRPSTPSTTPTSTTQTSTTTTVPTTSSTTTKKIPTTRDDNKRKRQRKINKPITMFSSSSSNLLEEELVEDSRRLSQRKQTEIESTPIIRDYYPEMRQSTPLYNYFMRNKEIDITTVKNVIPNGGLMWSDEFIYLDMQKWKRTVSLTNSDNSFQYFSSHQDNSFVRNGILFIKPTLTADRHHGENFLRYGRLDLTREGCDSEKENCVARGSERSIINPVVSAQITTEKSFNFTVGTIEIKAKMPKGDWISGGIYLKPSNSRVGLKPGSGEVKIASVRGNERFDCRGINYGRQMVTSGLSFEAPLDDKLSPSLAIFKFNKTVDFSSDFHLYRINVTLDGIKFFIDDKMAGEVEAHSDGDPFHIAMNVKVGGNVFPVNCDYGPFIKSLSEHAYPMSNFWDMQYNWARTWDMTEDNSAMQIDYIRVYSSLSKQ